MTVLVVATLLLVSAGSGIAHPGRTDGNGGHYDRRSGVYHYHSYQPSTQSRKPWYDSSKKTRNDPYIYPRNDSPYQINKKKKKLWP
mgnify:CR=1 FL=1